MNNRKDIRSHRFFGLKELLLFYFIVLVSFNTTAQLKEHPLKALFLEAAIRFITWPDDSAFSPSLNNAEQLPKPSKIDIFTIGYFKNSPLIPYLEKTFHKKSIKSKLVRFMEVDSLQSINFCDLVIIPDDHLITVSRVIRITENKPILTVSENPRFLEKGVILCIVTKGNKIECHINKAEADSSGFKISHHLLKKSNIFFRKKS